MASNFNNDMNDTTNDPILPPGARVAEPTAVTDSPVAAGSVAPAQPAAVFARCDQVPVVSVAAPPEDGTECCGHRDVLPLAGTNSFDAEAWCPDCTYFKLRRTPKKREDGYRYVSDTGIRNAEFGSAFRTPRSELRTNSAFRVPNSEFDPPQSLNSLARSAHSPSGARSWYARQCRRASPDFPIFSSVTAR